MTRPTLVALFGRFLRFGFLAWGGPAAQIDMIRQELVEDEAWISRERFNRVLAVYQALPGPEAHELCVYFGMVARGRVGALLAGLGFMLPGFVLMLALSWWYVEHAAGMGALARVFAGFQVAVAALVVRAVHRIGSHAVHDRWLLGIAVGAAAAHLAGVHFGITLLVSGLLYGARRGWPTTVPLVIAWPLAPAVITAVTPGFVVLLLAGLRAGLLTFGGAYTVIPFLQHDAVQVGGWMTDAQFLDGLALSSILPAPMVILATFVGYVAGGPLGAVTITVGVFLPAFAFTMVGHAAVERLVEQPRVHAVLDGVTAGVVGIIGATALLVARTAIGGAPAALLFAVVLAVLYGWRSRAAIPVAVLLGGAAGLLIGI